MKKVSLEYPILLSELTEMAQKMQDELVKAVVDLEQQIMLVDSPMHADEEFKMLEEEGSLQENLWGINLYPDSFGTDKWIEFDSMINIRPRQQNRSRTVESIDIQNKIRQLVAKLVVK